MKITSKGQVTLPKKVREKMGLHPGTDVEFVEKNGQVVLIKGKSDTPLDRSLGILRQSPWKHADHLVQLLRGRP